jgi:hypothetical protein
MPRKKSFGKSPWLYIFSSLRIYVASQVTEFQNDERQTYQAPKYQKENGKMSTQHCVCTTYCPHDKMSTQLNVDILPFDILTFSNLRLYKITKNKFLVIYVCTYEFSKNSLLQYFWQIHYLLNTKTKQLTQY